jgi:DNA-binding PadR family transcriptional regulator
VCHASKYYRLKYTVYNHAEMQLNQTHVVLLGFLRDGPRTGYEIKALIDRSVRFFWNASVSAIYPELKRLSEAGLVRASQEGRRTTYELTDAGTVALREWLTADELPTFELRCEGMLKLFFSDGLDTAEQLELVGRLREAHEAKAAALRSVKPHAERAGGWPQTVREFGEEWNAWAIGWCERTEARLRAELEAAA